MISLQEIAEMTGGKLLTGNPKQQVSMFHFDTRKLERGGMFIALTSGKRDGHSFLHHAVKQGATAALISSKQINQQQYPGLSLLLVNDTEAAFQQLAASYRQRLQFPFIAVTGSNGKTTTKDMIAHLLAAKYRTFKTQGNFNNHLGIPLSLLQMKDEQYAVVELGMNHAGEIDFLANMVKPKISVLTNVGEAHIKYLGSKAKIAEAKGELLPHTDPGGYVLLNQDDPYVCSQAKRYTGKIRYFSIREKADIYASQIEQAEGGTSFVVHLDGKSTTCFMPMFGTHNVSNVLPAIDIAYRAGIDLDTIKKHLFHLSVSGMRFELLKGRNGALLINDAYNASPTSMKAAINTFFGIYPARKKVLVLGDMFELGDESEEMHREVGMYLKQRTKDLDVVLITVGKDSRWISRVFGGTHVEQKEQAIAELETYLTDEHAILFKASRGMQLEQLLALIQTD